MNRTSKLVTENYRNLLYAVGISSEPIAPGKLEKKIGSKYLYEMLNNLCPSSSNELFLFEWNKAYLNKNKRKIVEKINSVFHVNFHTQKKADNLNYYDEVDHKLDCVLKSVDDNIDELIISDSVSLTEVKINLQKNHLMATLYVVKDNKKGRPSHLIVRERQNKFLIYVELFNFMSMTNKGYLNVSLKQNIIKKIQLLKQYIDNQILIEELTKKKGNLTPYQLKGGLQEEIDNMTKNRQNWRYRLNLRGLLYYLYLEFNLKRPDKRRIIKVISNPSVTKDLIFLHNWQDFEATGFDVFGTLERIANQFGNKLETHDVYSIVNQTENYIHLLFEVTEQYFGSLYLYFELIPDHKYKMDQKSTSVLKKYYLEILEYLNLNLKYQIQTIEKLLKYHSEYG